MKLSRASQFPRHCKKRHCPTRRDSMDHASVNGSKTVSEFRTMPRRSSVLSVSINEDAASIRDQKNGTSHLPKATSFSAERQQAAYMAASSKTKSYEAKHNSKKRSHRNKHKNKKARKLAENLITVNTPTNVKKTSDKECTEQIIFVDGGDASNPRINPEVYQDPLKKQKEMCILDISRGDLVVAKDHLNDPAVGIRSAPLLPCTEDGVPPHYDPISTFILPPREDAIRTLQTFKGGFCRDLCTALDAVENASASSEQRGNDKHVIRHGNYVCEGTQKKRAAQDIRPVTPALLKAAKDPKNNLHPIGDLVVRVEQMFKRWLPTDEIRKTLHGISLIDPQLLTIPGCPKKAAIYNAWAHGRNAFLNAHKDQDFTTSATLVLMKDRACHPTDKVVAYFNFPRLGIAVPLRPGDLLFFNPQEPHCISSRCSDKDEIYCISFYLKSEILGLNNNDMKNPVNINRLAEEYRNKNT